MHSNICVALHKQKIRYFYATTPKSIPLHYIILIISLIVTAIILAIHCQNQYRAKEDVSLQLQYLFNCSQIMFNLNDSIHVLSQYNNVAFVQQ